MIKAIGFDWGGVLNGQPSSIFRAKVEKLLGITTQQYQTAYFRHNKKANRGEITWPELWKLVLGDLNKLDYLPEVTHIAEEANKDSLNTNMVELVDTLRSSGYQVGLLSNNSIEKANLMRTQGLPPHFDAFHISAETGFVKPEPEAFLHLAKELGVDIHELVFIDDAPKSLSTASEVGYTPILFTGYDALTANLRQLNIHL